VVFSSWVSFSYGRGGANDSASTVPVGVDGSGIAGPPGSDTCRGKYVKSELLSSTGNDRVSGER
jgi:hypothetical protein